ncbi:hypothetical protein J3459_013949 [Metarhizium acridum]|nr:hypothetical protein J3459_013949 [Metarhizium acridum]
MTQTSAAVSGAPSSHSKADIGRFSDGDKPIDAAVDPDVVDFDGPDDSDNPMNWSPGKKAATIGMATAMTLFSYVHCTNLYLRQAWTRIVRNINPVLIYAGQ